MIRLLQVGMGLDFCLIREMYVRFIVMGKMSRINEDIHCNRDVT